MHPALSVIFFTVSSGAGYGLFMALALTLPTTRMAANDALIFGGVALVLVTLGLISSVGHLANPKNAWRAFSRFRTSWLSREGLLAVVFYLPASVYLYLLFEASVAPVAAAWTAWWSLLSATIFILALAIVFSTGMIYACLKTIRHWHTPLVPANYIAMALCSGMMLFLTLLFWSDHATRSQHIVEHVGITLVALGAALLLKWIYYYWVGRPQDAAQGSNIQTATGFHRAKVRLLDVGYTSGNFLTDEFGYRIDAARIRALRFTVLVLAFIVPILLVMTLLVHPSPIAASLALASNLAGTLLERWLFFAEARHVVNLYHGAQRA